MHITKHAAFIAALWVLSGCYSTGGILERDTGPDTAVRPDAALVFRDAPGTDGPRTLADAPRGDGAGEIWEGYVEAFSFASGSDRVRLVLDSAPEGDGTRTGTLTFGEGAPPAPATDPLVGYPLEGEVTRDTSLYEGFAYRLESGERTGARTQAAIASWSLWEDWCQLQTPYLVAGTDAWTCLPPNQGYGAGEGGCALASADDPDSYVEIDCGRMGLCLGQTCACSADGCTYLRAITNEIDFRATGDEATGTIVLGTESHVVHLTRVR